MGKLKVLHFIDSLGSGGAERLLHTNLKHFDKGRIDSEIVTIFSHGDYWKPQIEELGFRVSSLGCTAVSQIPIAAARLVAKLKVSKPDLIHTHLWTANVVGRIAGRLTGIPVLCSVHNPDYEPESIRDGSDVNVVKRYLIRKFDSLTASFWRGQLIAVSEYVKQSTSRRLRFPAERILVLYNPVDTDAFRQRTELERKVFFDAIGFKSNELILLNVGRVVPQKGLIDAVRALPKIRAKYPDAKLVSIGATNNDLWLKTIENEISRLGLHDAVHLLGERRDVMDFVQHCDIFVFPSQHEGLGIALIEAMAAGCAVVASNIGPISEFVTHEENGLLVPPKDPQKLSQAILKLLDNKEKRTRLGRKARETAYSRFQPQPAADALTKIYYSLLSKAPKI